MNPLRNLGLYGLLTRQALLLIGTEAMVLEDLSENKHGPYLVCSVNNGIAYYSEKGPPKHFKRDKIDNTYRLSKYAFIKQCQKQTLDFWLRLQRNNPTDLANTCHWQSNECIH